MEIDDKLYLIFIYFSCSGFQSRFFIYIDFAGNRTSNTAADDVTN